MWLLGCNLRRDLYILFSVKRIFVTVDRIFIDLCNPRRHKNIWKGPYFIQTRGPWHNLWQIMSFSTLTFCARVWNIANMLRYKVVSGENVIGGAWAGAHSSRLTEPTGNSNAPSSRESRESTLVTLYVSYLLLCAIQWSTYVSLMRIIRHNLSVIQIANWQKVLILEQHIKYCYLQATDSIRVLS